MKKFKPILAALAGFLLAAVALLGTEALATKTKLSPSELLTKLSNRTWPQKLYMGAERPAARTTLGAMIADRPLRLRGLTLDVGQPAVSSQTASITAYLILNPNQPSPAAVTGSTVAISSHAAGGTQASVAFDMAINPGDVILVRQGTCGGTNCARYVSARLDTVEDFAP